MIILIFIIIFYFTGCSSSELDDLAIVTSMQIRQQSDTLTIYAEILQMGPKDATASETSQIISISGNDLADCLRKLDATESRDIYLGHMRLMILGTSYLESAAPETISEIADYALISDQIRFNVLLAASDDSKDIAIKNSTTASGNRGIDLTEEIRKNTVIFDISDLINCISYYRDNVRLPVIETITADDRKYASISPEKYYDLSVFQDYASYKKELAS